MCVPTDEIRAARIEKVRGRAPPHPLRLPLPTGEGSSRAARLSYETAAVGREALHGGRWHGGLRQGQNKEILTLRVAPLLRLQPPCREASLLRLRPPFHKEGVFSVACVFS